MTMAAKELIAPNDRMSDLADNIGSISNLPQMWQTSSRFAYDMLKIGLTPSALTALWTG
jgi:hypothetical protein